MRRRVVEEMGYLNPEYQLILDHELWVRMASRYPIRHVPRFWSIERTHETAKTIAQAAGFVEEAERLVRWASSDPRLASLVEGNERRVRGGMEVFAARRLIDAGEYREAVRRLWVASKYDLPTVGRYWYKFVQAGGSALGMAGLFDRYRRARRRIVHRRRVVDLGPAESPIRTGGRQDG
ncbi:MAG: hypothetical protein HW375_704 [Anaerolineales bacterium]|nr:hypothetical protein [Anaerolineales bacterium]